jgi:hypothetical protein
VLVHFPKKKGMTRYFVEKICSKYPSGSEVQIQVYKQIGKIRKFVTESEEIFDFSEAVESKGSAQVAGQL